MVVTRSGDKIEESVSQKQFLMFLYRRTAGRLLLRLLRAKWVSVCTGGWMDSRFSAGMARKAVRTGAMDLAGVALPQGDRTFPSYNALFTRQRAPETFPICTDVHRLCSPADSRLTIVPLQEGTAFPVKQAPYTVAQLLEDPVEAKRFTGGYALVFRLSVEDYHRYAYPDDGRELAHRVLRGTLHTVNPVALETVPVFHRNCREVSLLESAHFGVIAYIEVGAMLVGRIVNHRKPVFTRGEEKGYFAYGGSTVVLLIEPNRITPDADLLQNSLAGIETYVRAGEAVAQSTKK